MQDQAPQQWWSIRSDLQPDRWCNSGTSTMLAHSRAIIAYGDGRSKVQGVCVCVCVCVCMCAHERVRRHVCVYDRSDILLSTAFQLACACCCQTLRRPLVCPFMSCCHCRRRCSCRCCRCCRCCCCCCCCCFWWWWW